MQLEQETLFGGVEQITIPGNDVERVEQEFVAQYLAILAMSHQEETLF